MNYSQVMWESNDRTKINPEQSKDMSNIFPKVMLLAIKLRLRILRFPLIEITKFVYSNSSTSMLDSCSKIQNSPFKKIIVLRRTHLTASESLFEPETKSVITEYHQTSIAKSFHKRETSKLGIKPRKFTSPRGQS